LPWSHNLAIMSRSKLDEEREFYLRIAARERWSFRDLQRQLDGALFERSVRSPPKLSTPLREIHPSAAAVFKDTYHEALDRDIRKSHEGPSIGVVLCATKNSEVVEYALNRAASPTIVAEYQRQLPTKKLLRAKLQEFYALAEQQAELPAIADRKNAAPPKKKPYKRRRK